MAEFAFGTGSRVTATRLALGGLLCGLVVIDLGKGREKMPKLLKS